MLTVVLGASETIYFVHLIKSSSSIVCVNELLLRREVLFQMLHCKVPIICFNAKDFLRTLLQVYGNEISWKQGNYLI